METSTHLLGPSTGTAAECQQTPFPGFSSCLHRWQIFWRLSFWENCLSSFITPRYNLGLWILPWRSGAYDVVAAMEFHLSKSLVGLFSDCTVWFLFITIFIYYILYLLLWFNFITIFLYFRYWLLKKNGSCEGWRSLMCHGLGIKSRAKMRECVVKYSCHGVLDYQLEKHLFFKKLKSACFFLFSKNIQVVKWILRSCAFKFLLILISWR